MPRSMVQTSRMRFWTSRCSRCTFANVWHAIMLSYVGFKNPQQSVLADTRVLAAATETVPLCRR